NDSLMYFRQSNLWRQQIGSKTELEQKALAYENAKTAYFSSVVRYNDLRRQLKFNDAQSRQNVLISGSIAKDYIVRSRLDGILYSLNPEKGEIVSTQMPLAVVGAADKFILELRVDEYDIFKINNGM